MSENRQLHQPGVLWLTGLSGAGKTTLANSLVAHFRKEFITPVLLDGDEIREAMKVEGFDEASRKKHNLNVGQLAALLERQGHLVIVSLISPYAAVRNEIRLMCARFIEVHISTDLETCIRRDPKGLYKKAIAGEINNFTGISAVYEVPLQPELTINAGDLSVEDCVAQILTFYHKEK